MHLERCPINRIELKSTCFIVNWPIKILPGSTCSIIIIFAVHNLKIILELSFNHFCVISFWRLRINWLSSVPIIFYTLIIKAIISNAIGRNFINILQLILILSLTWRFIKILFVHSMPSVVILAISNWCSIVIWSNSSGSR